MKALKFGALVLALAFAGSANAEQSEFKKKMQESLDEYAKTVGTACGGTVKASWGGGKFASNPMESEKPEWSALSTLCTSGMQAVQDACANNEVVKKKLGGVKTVECT